MHILTEVIVGLTLLVSAVALVTISIKLHNISELIKIAVFPDPCCCHRCGPRTSGEAPGGLAHFIWRVVDGEGEWVLDTDLSSPGYVPVPPTSPGSYDGQVLKKACVPQTE